MSKHRRNLRRPLSKHRHEILVIHEFSLHLLHADESDKSAYFLLLRYWIHYFIRILIETSENLMEMLHKTVVCVCDLNSPADPKHQILSWKPTLTMQRSVVIWGQYFDACVPMISVSRIIMMGRIHDRTECMENLIKICVRDRRYIFLNGEGAGWVFDSWVSRKIFHFRLIKTL